MKSARIEKTTKKREIVGIKIFTGEDRLKTQVAVVDEFGKDYEVFEGENVTTMDLPGIFFGTTLFAAGPRKVLIKDLSENKEAWNALSEKIEEFVKSDAKVVLWESKLDKRLASVKALVKAGVEVSEFQAKEAIDTRVVFDIYNMALRNGPRAVKELERIETKQDPYMFFGLLVSQAAKKLEWNPRGGKEKKLLKELSRIDMQMKSTAVEPWMLIKSFLLRASVI